MQHPDSLLLEEAAEIGARRIYVDGVAGAASTVGGAELRDSFHVLVEGLQRENLTAVLAVEASASDGDRGTVLPEESIADTGAPDAAVYNHEHPEMPGMSSMMGDFAMSSLVDNILLMSWIELGDAFRLGLTVANMRSNPNTRSTHECEILDGHGLRVLPRQISVSRAYPFASYQNLISRAPVRRVDRDAE